MVCIRGTVLICLTFYLPEGRVEKGGGFAIKKTYWVFSCYALLELEFWLEWFYWFGQPVAQMDFAVIREPVGSGFFCRDYCVVFYILRGGCSQEKSLFLVLGHQGWGALKKCFALEVYFCWVYVVVLWCRWGGNSCGRYIRNADMNKLDENIDPAYYKIFKVKA